MRPWRRESTHLTQHVACAEACEHSAEPAPRPIHNRARVARHVAAHREHGRVKQLWIQRYQGRPPCVHQTPMIRPDPNVGTGGGMPASGHFLTALHP